MTPHPVPRRPPAGTVDAVAGPGPSHPDGWDEVTLDIGGRSVPLTLGISHGRLCGVRFGAAGEHASWIGAVPRSPRSLAEAAAQLQDYAAGDRKEFCLPLLLHGSDFQVAVWRELLNIPFGATATYGAVAAAIGRPGGARAAGSAIGSNPIAIVVPCHRVIGASGALTGFGGGLPTKSALLTHEGVTAL